MGKQETAIAPIIANMSGEFIPAKIRAVRQKGAIMRLKMMNFRVVLTMLGMEVGGSVILVFRYVLPEKDVAVALKARD
jgi:hypothetical protein